LVAQLKQSNNLIDSFDMNKWILLLLLMPFIACNFSSNKITLEGAGPRMDEIIDLYGFDKIVYYGPGLMKIRSETDYALIVKEYATLFDKLESYVEDNTLYIGYNSQYEIKNSSLEIVLVAPSIKEVIVQGTGDVHFIEIKDRESLSVITNGTGNIHFHYSDFDILRTHTQGTGSVYFTESQSNSYIAKINGTGSQYSAELKTSIAKVDINGAGNAVVNASDSLYASIKGVGNIRYLKDPVVVQKVSGIGKVTRMGQ
jgi:hypothetical protein